jgi:hypothetical protein
LKDPSHGEYDLDLVHWKADDDYSTSADEVKKNFLVIAKDLREF